MAFKSMITPQYYAMLPFRRTCESLKYWAALPWVLLSNSISVIQGKPLETSVHVS